MIKLGTATHLWEKLTAIWPEVQSFPIYRLGRGDYNLAYRQSLLNDYLVHQGRACNIHIEEIRKIKQVVLTSRKVINDINIARQALPGPAITDIPNL